MNEAQAPGRLRERSLAAFLAAVAATDPPVPAGGSVAALTGAAAASLLALVCGVREKHGAHELAALRARAEELSERLLELVDEDAAAFAELTRARRSGGASPEAVVRSTRAPLVIAGRCVEVAELARTVAPHARGAVHGDAQTAERLAGAAADSALGLAEEDARRVKDVGQRRELLDEIDRLRTAQSPPS